MFFSALYKVMEKTERVVLRTVDPLRGDHILFEGMLIGLDDSIFSYDQMLVTKIYHRDIPQGKGYQSITLKGERVRK